MSREYSVRQPRTWAATTTGAPGVCFATNESLELPLCGQGSPVQARIALGIEEHDLERDGMLEIEECHPNYPNYVEVCFVPPSERLPAYRYRPQA
jgi:hypothetical protein